MVNHTQDFVAVKKYEILQYSLIPIIGPMYLEITGHPYLIFNGIFGMAKGSKFLKFALETIKLNYEQTPDYTARWVPARTGPVFFTSVFVS